MGGPAQKGIVTYCMWSLTTYLCTRYSLTHPIIPESYPSNWHLCLLFICCVVALSPFQQRAFKGVVSGYLFNGYTRIAAQVPYFFVPLATGTYPEFLLSPCFFFPFWTCLMVWLLRRAVIPGDATSALTHCTSRMFTLKLFLCLHKRLLFERMRKTSSTANQCSSPAYPCSSHVLCPGNRRAFFAACFLLCVHLLLVLPMQVPGVGVIDMLADLGNLCAFYNIYFHFSYLHRCASSMASYIGFQLFILDLHNDFILTCISPLAYGIYVWANKTDEYNNSKAGHLAQGGSH